MFFFFYKKEPSSTLFLFWCKKLNKSCWEIQFFCQNVFCVCLNCFARSLVHNCFWILLAGTSFTMISEGSSLGSPQVKKFLATLLTLVEDHPKDEGQWKDKGRWKDDEMMAGPNPMCERGQNFFVCAFIYFCAVSKLIDQNRLFMFPWHFYICGLIILWKLSMFLQTFTWELSNHKSKSTVRTYGRFIGILLWSLRYMCAISIKNYPFSRTDVWRKFSDPRVGSLRAEGDF